MNLYQIHRRIARGHERALRIHPGTPPLIGLVAPPPAPAPAEQLPDNAAWSDDPGTLDLIVPGENVSASQKPEIPETTPLSATLERKPRVLTPEQRAARQARDKARRAAKKESVG